MQCARARDQLPPTMDHKGTVEISSEYHAVGGMGIGQPAVTLPTRGTFLFKANLEFFLLDSVYKPSVFQQALGYQCLQISTEQIKSG